jgi:hypothetical protein
MVGRVVPLTTTSDQTAAAAAAAFLAQPTLARSTCRCYDQTLTRLVHELGSDRPLSTLTVEAITVAVTTAWVGGRRRPGTATWPPSGPSWGSATGGAGWLMTSPSTWSAGQSLLTAPRPLPSPSWSGCGAARTSACGRRRCGRCRELKPSRYSRLGQPLCGLR